MKTINNIEAGRVAAWILELKEQHNNRAELLSVKRRRLNDLQPYVDEYEEVMSEIKELRADQRDQFRFLSELISFAEKATGEIYIDDGPLFEAANIIQS